MLASPFQARGGRGVSIPTLDRRRGGPSARFRGTASGLGADGARSVLEARSPIGCQDRVSTPIQGRDGHPGTGSVLGLGLVGRLLARKRLLELTDALPHRLTHLG